MAIFHYTLNSSSQHLKHDDSKRCLPKDAFFVALKKVAIFFILTNGLLLTPVLADDCNLSSGKLSQAINANVARIVDGDTVRLSDGKLVRFIGINTPEIDHENGSSEPVAEKARDYLSAIISKFDDKVLLQIGVESHDRHGRLLAHLFTPDGENVEANMLRKGLGVWIVVPPNLEYMSCYRRAEKFARDAGEGVWGQQFKKPRATKSLTNRDRGFQWIRGKIIRLGKGKKFWWLNFEELAMQQQPVQWHSKVTLRVSKDDLHYFKERPLERLVNKVVQVKGWLGQYREQLVMSLKHPASIEIINE